MKCQHCGDKISLWTLLNWGRCMDCELIMEERARKNYAKYCEERSKRIEMKRERFFK